MNSSNASFFDPIYADRHSIEEANLVLLLDRSVDKPEDFINDPSLINEGYTVLPNSSLTFNFDVGNLDQVKPAANPCIGFRAILGDEHGKILQVFNLMNETSRTVLSFHQLNYNRWEGFKNSFQKTLKLVTEKLSIYSVIRFGLQYQDVFVWHGLDAISLNKLFSADSDYFPQVMMRSIAVDYTLALKTETAGSSDSTETLNIQTIDSPGIRITHHISVNLTTPVIASEIFDNLTFLKALDSAHSHNKAILGRILKPDIIDKIGLNIKI